MGAWDVTAESVGSGTVRVTIKPQLNTNMLRAVIRMFGQNNSQAYAFRSDDDTVITVVHTRNRTLHSLVLVQEMVYKVLDQQEQSQHKSPSRRSMS